MLRKIRVFVKDVAKRDAETLIFAANELKKYLQSLTTKDIMLIEERDDEYAASFDGISLGLNLSEKLIPTADPKSEDSILIDVTGEDGLITGVNPRAVLLAVYRYLREMGFFFLRPGKDGEIYPEALKTDIHALYRAVGLKTPGQGIAFSMPVDAVVGLTPAE